MLLVRVNIKICVYEESKYVADSSASLDSPEMFVIVPWQKPVGRSWDSNETKS